MRNSLIFPVQAALAVGRNLMPISKPTAAAKIVAETDFTTTAVKITTNTRPRPVDREILRVITMGIRITPKKISNPYQYP